LTILLADQKQIYVIPREYSAKNNIPMKATFIIDDYASNYVDAFFSPFVFLRNLSNNQIFLLLNFRNKLYFYEIKIFARAHEIFIASSKTSVAKTETRGFEIP